MEQTPEHYRRVHKPRAKLKMPLFGNMFGGSGGNQKPASSRDDTSLYNKLTPIIIAIAVIAFGIDYFRTKNDTKRTYRGAEEIQAMQFNGKIMRKWYNVIPPNSEIEYVVELFNDKNEKRIISFKDEKTNFGDLILPKNTIIKKEGSLDVTLKRYHKADTVLTLKY
ncbi:hypothetical protein VB796_08435 [Arcicella sp. LKC2W]|uniref:hypothetical protein n=1 Tax=Arcicella sp. LKC2W TaxID=2984198 RepID=UPI002B201780|nr:hypothetical protein [Arcicella sp. LKC2W]MEA5459061.1 hypothetical protein [Arcicella sp. LKC2W]